MRLAGQLQEAVGARLLDEAAEKVVLTVGQLVAVRTKRGVNVIKKGRITKVDLPTGIVRVRDDSSGATLEVDVDPSKYLVWVLPPPSSTETRMNRIRTLYVRGGGLRPSAYQGGKWP
jgi:hypothetical protein